MKQNKTYKIFKAIILFLPLIFWLIAFMKNHIADNETYIFSEKIFTDSINSLITYLKPLENLIWYQPLLNILNTNLGFTGTYFTLIYMLFNYVVVVETIELIFYLFLYFIKLIKNVFISLGGNL